MNAAVRLSRADRDIHLFESAAHLGGRAFSFAEKNSGLTYDNGQHLMMGCYEETLRFLNTIGADTHLKTIFPAKISYRSKAHGAFALRAARLPAPFHLLTSLLFGFKPLRIAEHLSVIFLATSLVFPSREKLKRQTLATWLGNKRQSENTIFYLWRFIAVAILNAEPSELSAYTFREALRILFIKKSKNIAPVLARVGLSELTEGHFFAWMQKNGNSVHLNQRVVNIKNGTNLSLATTKGTFEFDKVVLALPYHAASKLVSLPTLACTYSSILSVHFVYDDELFSEAFVGMPESRVHWVFRKDAFAERREHIYSAVISAADAYLGKTKESITEMFYGEMEVFFPRFSRTRVQYLKIVHEKRATPVFSPEFTSTVPAPFQAEKNIYVCGDWTQTGLPATIESACKSAKIISQIIE